VATSDADAIWPTVAASAPAYVDSTNLAAINLAGTNPDVAASPTSAASATADTGANTVCAVAALRASRGDRT